MTILTLLFDADEVLQYPRSGRDADLRRIFGLAPESIAPFVAEVHAVEDTCLTGSLEVRGAFAPLLSHWGLGDQARELVDWLNDITVDPGMLELVALLRACGYCCALATNQQHCRAAFMSQQLGYESLFDRCFFSCRMGVAKPDSRYFQMILAELRREPCEVLFIDDKPQNVEAARAVGIHGVCFANVRNGLAHLELREVLARLGVTTGV